MLRHGLRDRAHADLVPAVSDSHGRDASPLRLFEQQVDAGAPHAVVDRAHAVVHAVSCAPDPLRGEEERRLVAVEQFPGLRLRVGVGGRERQQRCNGEAAVLRRDLRQFVWEHAEARAGQDRLHAGQQRLLGDQDTVDPLGE